MNRANWDADDVRDDLQGYVAEHLGEGAGVLVVDDTGFVKKGITSAGVRRQHSGTAGRTENCQIGVFAAYATTRGRALVDRELYLPKSRTDDRDRCRAVKVSDERGFATKGELAKRLVLRALASELPIAWVTADAAYGQEGRFRRLLEQSGIGYVCSRSPNPSRSSARASTISSPRLPTRHGRRCPAAKEPRALGSTTGPPWDCPPCPSSTTRAGSPSADGGYWPAVVSASLRKSPTSLPAHHSTSPWKRWSGSPGCAGRSKSGSRPRRTNAAWTSTKSADTWAGTGTSRWRCWPTPVWQS
ncbi:IS701 family transposase [Streptomyces sp. NPDC088748]|uniref:IS701 family transposase n=1 Tax=Streptomyces sp. NPDC088748 TaxID=3365887 RepID=UPI00381DDB73